MKNVTKLLVSVVSVFMVCLSIVGVGAVTTYGASATSSYHNLGGGHQYFVVDAVCKDYGSDRTVDSWTYEWFHYGTSSHTYTQSTVRKTSTGNYKVNYSGTSYINYAGYPLSATLNY